MLQLPPVSLEFKQEEPQLRFHNFQVHTPSKNLFLGSALEIESLSPVYHCTTYDIYAVGGLVECRCGRFKGKYGILRYHVGTKRKRAVIDFDGHMRQYDLRHVSPRMWRKGEGPHERLRYIDPYPEGFKE
jgi:hypothetical protein